MNNEAGLPEQRPPFLAGARAVFWSGSGSDSTVKYVILTSVADPDDFCPDPKFPQIFCYFSFFLFYSEFLNPVCWIRNYLFWIRIRSNFPDLDPDPAPSPTPTPTSTSTRL